jgi:hypothetical protein
LTGKSSKYGQDGKGMSRNSNRDDMQLISYPSYMANTNDKRSSQQQRQTKTQQEPQKLTKASMNMEDMNSKVNKVINSNTIGEDFNLPSDEDAIYFDDDGAYLNEDPYDSNNNNNVNEFFNNFNQDNINDYYYYLNQLLFNSNNAKND